MDVVTLAAAKAAARNTYAAQVAPGVKLYNPYGLRRWSKALNDANLGLANVVCLGDSITSGVGSDGNSGGSAATTWRTNGWVAQLRTLFAATYGATGEGLLSPYDSSAFAYVGAGIHNSAAPYESGNRAVGNTQTITASLSTSTGFEFWTWDGGNGTASYNIDGAGAVTFSAGSGNTALTTWTKTTVTGLSSATHSVVFTGPSGGTLYLSAVSATVGTTGVRVHRLSRSGNTTANLVGQDSLLNGNSAGQTRSINSIGLVPPADLVIISLGTNDFAGQNSTAASGAQPGTTPTTYAANLLTAATAIITNGACVLLAGEPRQYSGNYPSPATYTEQNYYDAAKAVALANDHIAYMDIGDLLGSWTDSNTMGYQTTNSVHPARVGHGAIARLMHRALTMPVGRNAPALV